jgi:hypothetical protein
MPRTYTTTHTVYKYTELSPESQERARDAARARDWYGDPWAEEWRDTLKRAADAFSVEAGDWSVDVYGRRGTYANLRVRDDDVYGRRGTTYANLRVRDDDVAELAGVRAWKYLRAHYADAIAEDCPFTGYCGDESLLAPLRAFLARPNTTSTVQDIMDECASAWAYGWRDDIEHQFSDEYVVDDLEVNEREFYEDGSFAD